MTFLFVSGSLLASFVFGIIDNTLGFSTFSAWLCSLINKFKRGSRPIHFDTRAVTINSFHGAYLVLCPIRAHLTGLQLQICAARNHKPWALSQYVYTSTRLLINVCGQPNLILYLFFSFKWYYILLKPIACFLQAWQRYFHSIRNLWKNYKSSSPLVSVIRTSAMENTYGYSTKEMLCNTC